MNPLLALAGLLNAAPTGERCKRCQRIIDETKEFRDHKSYAEWKKNHKCQQCQDFELSYAEDDESSLYFAQ